MNMAKRSPRLIFTEEERALPELERAVRKADRAAVKLEKAEAKIPKKTVKVKKRVVDSENGKVTTRLFFEEADKKRPPSKLAHAARKAPLDTVRSAVHRKLREEGDDNPGTEAANTLTETAERTWRIAESAHRSHAEKPYRRADKAEAAADKANLKALNKQYEQEYGRASNPYSRWQQKQAIKKEYAAAKAGNGARNTVKASETTAKAAKRAAEGSKKAGSFFVRHKKGFLIAGGVAAAILLLMTCISSCSTLFQGGVSGVAASTYPLEDADMLAAEAAYCAMEDELREYLNSYERTHDYDEYHFDLDEIEHDPYVLISMITALKGGEWTIDEIGGILETLFEKQYILNGNRRHGNQIPHRNAYRLLHRRKRQSAKLRVRGGGAVHLLYLPCGAGKLQPLPCAGAYHVPRSALHVRRVYERAGQPPRPVPRFPVCEPVLPHTV